MQETLWTERVFFFKGLLYFCVIIFGPCWLFAADLWAAWSTSFLPTRPKRFSGVTWVQWTHCPLSWKVGAKSGPTLLLLLQQQQQQSGLLMQGRGGSDFSSTLQKSCCRSYESSDQTACCCCCPSIDLLTRVRPSERCCTHSFIYRSRLVTWNNFFLVFNSK